MGTCSQESKELVSNHKPLPNGPLPTNKCILPCAHCTQHKFQNLEPKIEANNWTPKPTKYQKPRKLQKALQASRMNIVTSIFLLPNRYGMSIRERLNVIEILRKHLHISSHVANQTVTKFAHNERQSVEATFTFNGSQNLAHGNFDKLHKLRDKLNE